MSHPQAESPARAAATADLSHVEQSRLDRAKSVNARLAVLVPLLSTHPLLITTFVDRKNADEWAIAMATVSCIALAYIEHVMRTNSRQIQRIEVQFLDAKQRIRYHLSRIQSGARARTVALLVAILTFSIPFAANSMVGARNYEEWMCFFGVLCGLELFRVVRICRRTQQETRTRMIQLLTALRSDDDVDRLQLSSEIGRRLYAVFERIELEQQTQNDRVA